MGSLGEKKVNSKVVQIVHFNSAHKCMIVVIKVENGKHRMLVNGAAEILVSKSPQIVRDSTKEPSKTALTEENRGALDTIMLNYTPRALRNIALVYRDFEQRPPREALTQENDCNMAAFVSPSRDMVMFEIFGIQDPLRAD